jgi:superfamily II helicase
MQINPFEKKEEPPRICRKCVLEMKEQGVRESSGTKYLVFKCEKCSKEELVMLH